MVKTRMTGRFDWKSPEIEATLAQGPDAYELYHSIPKVIRERIGYNSETKEIIGSTPFFVVRVDTELNGLGIRTPRLKDLIREEVAILIGADIMRILLL
ncbi:hypothetical protein HYV50_00115 [Candidatus Pacearchaeota archaeon]|nr:hypothetical protein [Candidatus Pacearchaeota archaeon]